MSAKNEFVLLLETIEKDKGIPRQEIMRLIEGALASAMQKHIGRETPVRVEMDAQTGEMRAYLIKKAVELVQDPITEILLGQAQQIDSQAQKDSSVAVVVDTSDFTRIAAQTAKQVILQKLREVEKENLFKDFKKKESLIVTGSVYRHGHDRIVYVSLGKIEAILKKEDQIPGERFVVGQTIKALVRAVEVGGKGPQVYLSRSLPEFIKSLLRLEVPEVHEGIVEILKVARSPGWRSKVLVRSKDPKVDPVGSCVGIRGTRIRPIIAELHGEKIDLIPGGDNPSALVVASLAPAKVERLKIEDSEKKVIRAYVPAQEMAGVVGKDGINLKLAMELTGWSIILEEQPGSVSSEAVPAPAGSAPQGPQVQQSPIAAGSAPPAPPSESAVQVVFGEHSDTAPTFLDEKKVEG